MTYNNIFDFSRQMKFQREVNKEKNEKTNFFNLRIKKKISFKKSHPATVKGFQHKVSTLVNGR